MAQSGAIQRAWLLSIWHQEGNTMPYGANSKRVVQACARARPAGAGSGATHFGGGSRSFRFGEFPLALVAPRQAGVTQAAERANVDVGFDLSPSPSRQSSRRIFRAWPEGAPGRHSRAPHVFRRDRRRRLAACGRAAALLGLAPRCAIAVRFRRQDGRGAMVRATQCRTSDWCFR